MSAEVLPLRRRVTPGTSPMTQFLRQEGLGQVTDFLGSFATHLRARPASEATVYRYVLAATQLAEFLGDPDVGAITRADVEAFIVHRMELTAGSTVAGTFVALVQFFKFVALDVKPDVFTPPTEGMTTPAFEERPIPVPELALVEGMIRHANRQRDHAGAKTFEGIRDEAILRMFFDTGARLAEITHLRLDQLGGDRIQVEGKSKGKGKVLRTVRLSEATQGALKRYLRIRVLHPHVQSEALWLARKGPMSTSGVRQMIWKRSQAVAGPEGRLHPHQFRHLLAHTWKSQPGNHDGDLMEVMGWRTQTMLHRYGKSAAAERAGNAHARFLESRG